MKNISTESLGSFETSGVLCVTDPCYRRGTWCTAYAIACRPGTWESEIKLADFGGWGRRVASLEAHCAAVSVAELSQIPWEEHPNEIGVDSGQCGIFDQGRYPEGKAGNYGELDTFYGRACSATHDENNEVRRYAGVIAEGAVSSSGFGDGSYRVFTRALDGKVVQVLVLFVNDEEDDLE